MTKLDSELSQEKQKTKQFREQVKTNEGLVCVDVIGFNYLHQHRNNNPQHQPMACTCVYG